MEVAEKEIMEIIGKGEIYRQAAALHAKLAYTSTRRMRNNN